MARRIFWGDSDSKLAFILFCFTVVLGSLLSPPDCQRSSWQTWLFIASPRQPGLFCLSRLKEVLMFKKTPQTLNKHLPEIKTLSMNFYRCIFPPVSSCTRIQHQYLNFFKFSFWLLVPAEEKKNVRLTHQPGDTAVSLRNVCWAPRACAVKFWGTPAVIVCEISC